MRPIIYGQNPLIHPLNELLGTEAHVRLLRILANDVEGSLTASDAAERAGITPQGAFKALKRLVRSGFIIQIGGGRKRQYALRRNDKLVEALLDLFQTEANRYNLLIENIKKKIEVPESAPRSVWIEKFPDEFEDSLVLGVIHQTRHLNSYVSELQNELRMIEQEFDITIEVMGYTKADIPLLTSGETKHLYGIPPFRDHNTIELLSGMKKHEDVDDYLLKICHTLSVLIEQDIALVRRAKNHVQKLLEAEHGLATKSIEEWQKILETYSGRRLINFLVSRSQRATRLRQSCPFFAVLNNNEKAKIIAKLGGKVDSRTT
jgi:DNA-binding Lrp family transcriptional regulator